MERQTCSKNSAKLSKKLLGKKRASQQNIAKHIQIDEGEENFSYYDVYKNFYYLMILLSEEDKSNKSKLFFSDLI